MREKINKIGAYIFYVIIAFFMISILLRFVTKNILVEACGISNSFTKWALTGMSVMDAMDEVTGELYDRVDWEARYPFNETESQIQIQPAKSNTNILNKYKSKIAHIESVFNDYCNEYLVGRVQMIEKAYKYENLLQWSLIPLKSDNGIIIKDNGYLTYVSDKMDVSSMVDHVVDFNDYLSEKDISFVYVQAPSKIDPITPDLPAGIIDYTNENIDNLLNKLEQQDVNCLDLREFILEEYPTYEDAFFKTDHHWKTTTAFRASQVLVNHLNQQYQCGIDEKILSNDNFIVENYEDYFLGSQGKKVTLAVAKPEDYPLVVPQFDTDFTIQIPERRIDLRGAFQDTLLDYRHLEKIDYYNENCYASFMNRNDVYAKIVNHDENAAEKKILIIKDSYSTPLIPYLSLGVREIDTLYEMLFTGSIRTFVEKEQPDMVIVIYSASSLTPDASSHTAFYNLQ